MVASVVDSNGTVPTYGAATEGETMTGQDVFDAAGIACELAGQVGYGTPATVEDGGVVWRAEVWPDEFAHVNDYDCWGRVERVQENRDYVGGYGVQRPQGFDGAARKLSVGRSCDMFWWQPPDDVDSDQIECLQTEVVRLLEDGFWVVEVTRQELCDGCETLHDTHRLSFGAVSDSNDFASVLTDLVGEIFGDIELGMNYWAVA